MVYSNVYHAYLITKIKTDNNNQKERYLHVNMYRCKYQVFENILEDYFVLKEHNLEINEGDLSNENIE
jgi:hypothetical protein